MTRHVNIPIFIPHLGCPNQCVFCNQRIISGTREFDEGEVVQIIETALATLDRNVEVEIAFFGGSFTGIDYSLMCKLLDIAHSYVDSGRVKSIRCSTRPDYINDKILETLKRYGVGVIELGLQSASDNVLFLTKRGHDMAAASAACKKIKEYGFTLVGQMMIGLPGSDMETEMATARFIVEMGADAARIYPTVVFRDTELCNMAQRGAYTPLELDEAVVRSARVFTYFKENGVSVIRIGLCSSENLSTKETYYAGPNHPAIGELVVGEYYYSKILNLLSNTVPNKASVLKIYVSRGAVSKAVGQKKRNKIRLMENFAFDDVVFIEDDSLFEYEICVDIERKHDVFKDT